MQYAKIAGKRRSSGMNDHNLKRVMNAKLHVYTIFSFPLIFSILVFSCCKQPQNRSDGQKKLEFQGSSQVLPADDASIYWHHAADPNKINGVALVIHGLNLRPDRMEPIIALLTDSGIDVLNLSLRGHGPNHCHEADIDNARLEAFKTVSYKLWIDETYRAYQHARKRSDQKKTPLFFIGFSLGGLMEAELPLTYPDVAFDRMVLLAPALSMHAINYITKLLSPFPRLVIPSVASKHYRANSGVPMAAYNALFEAVEHFNTNAGPKINIPTLILVDPRDELISYKGLKRLAENKQLDQWKFHDIRKDEGIKNVLHHLIVDEASVGKDMWNEMKTAIINHLLP